jgi:uncharacterized protein (TIGR02147 family)
MAIENIKIYKYLDYRLYLKDYYSFKKKHSPDFSYRYFSEQVGVKAPNFLQWLIEGKRNLALKTIPKVSRALQLDAREEEYFTALVRFNQAETIASKTTFFEKLIQIHAPVKSQKLSVAQYQHYNHWYNEALRELLKYYKFSSSEKYAYRKLGKKVCPVISESQARKAIQQMLQLGLLREDKDGIVRQNEDFITTGDEVNSFFVQKFHENMISLAKDSMDRFPSETRDISSVTVSVSDPCFLLIKKEIQQMRKRIMELVKMDKKPDNVYQFNFQLFPLIPKKKLKA